MSDPEPTKSAAPRGEESGEESPAFRVIDRRRFAADGSEKATAGEPPLAPEPSATADPSAHAPTAAGREADRREEQRGDGFVMSEGHPARPGGGEAVAEPVFSTLLISLSTQALMHLGEIPDPTSGAQHKDLPAAKSLIDILAALEQKTRGNLDPIETDLLERILYDLRMRFVEVARS